MDAKYYPYGYCRNSTGDLGTDKLFTGQRLDDTGLYYYGARYYDPTIGRFISAAPFILSIMDPQSLNRYTYCLNNPLKYIDPTGFWGESLDNPYDEGALGWTSAEGWLIGIGGDWIPVAEQAVDTMISEYKESTSDTWTEFTQDFGLPIASEEAPSYTWGNNISKAGKASYFWGVESRYNREKDIAGQYPMEPRLTLIENYEMTTQDYILLCDVVAVGSDPFLAPGYVVSAVASTVGYGLTVSEYRKGNITQNDMLRAHINWTTGFIPFWGMIPEALQVYFDWPD